MNTDLIKSVVLSNKLGLHARAAAAFVKCATKFGSDIKICKDGVEINGKSIMGILMLAIRAGEPFEIKAFGEDSEEALSALQELIENKFGEDF